MAQKSIPVFNKVGYSMFWNSMWDNKNNFSKKFQKENFIKKFIKFFFYDFFQNRFVYHYNLKKIDLFILNNKYNLNNISKKIIYIIIWILNLIMRSLHLKFDYLNIKIE